MYNYKDRATGLFLVRSYWRAVAARGAAGVLAGPAPRVGSARADADSLASLAVSAELSARVLLYGQREEVERAQSGNSLLFTGKTSRRRRADVL